MASAKKKQDEKNLKILRELASQPYNKKCFDCGQRGPTYVNMTIGSFVCTSCSGILRGLNPPQRVKSISMTSFTPQEIEFLQGAGNEMCRKTWLGLWNSANSPEPESRDEQKVKDFMIQKYERRRWYIPAQQVSTSSTSSSNSVPEAKPLKQLLGKDIPTIQSSSPVQNTTRERPRTVSQSSLPAVVLPPVSSTVSEPPPPQKPATSFDLLSDLGGDPFAQPNQPQGFGAFGSQPQQPQQTSGIPGFGAFNQPPPQPASQAPFDPFGSSQPAQSMQSGFANFGQPQQQQQQQPPTQPLQQQSSGFDAFGAFASPVSSAPASQSTGAGFGPMVSATSSSSMPSTNPPQQAGDRYAALSALDSLFGPTPTVSSSGSHTSTSSGGSVFGSNSGTSLGMSSGPNPFASGGHQPTQPPSQAANPFQGLGNVGGSGGGFAQMNGPGRSLSPSSSTSTGITSSAGFGSFSSAQPSSTSFGQPAAQQPQAMSGGWGGMGGQHGMGMPASNANQNLSFGGAGATVMAANQFGKMPNQPNPMVGQAGGFGGGHGMQSGFGGAPMGGGGAPMGGAGTGTPASSAGFGQWGQSSSFGTQGGGQSSHIDGFGGGQTGGFGGQQSGFGGQQSGFGGQQSGFGGQQSGFGAPQGGFGAQQGQFGGQQQGRFPGQGPAVGGGGGGGFGGQTGGFGGAGGMMGGQFGQPQQQQQQQQQFGGWGQQGSQPNPFMGGGGQPQMQQQSTNPFM